MSRILSAIKAFLLENWLLLVVFLALCAVALWIWAIASAIGKGIEGWFSSSDSSRVGDLVTAPLDAPWWAWIPGVGILYWADWWLSDDSEEGA